MNIHQKEIIMFIYKILLLSIYCGCTLSLANNTCTTPNGEKAMCVSINNCPVIKKAITYLDEEAIKFAQASYCGKSNGTHWVCCGSTGNFVKSSTTVPTTSESIPLDNNFVPPPTPILDLNLPDASLCGIQNKQFRIIGGSIAELDEFPWMVALKYVNSDGSSAGFRCSGTLINEFYVLTAAQCLDIRGFKLAAARLGDWKLSTALDCTSDPPPEQICADHVIDARIKRIIPHPYFSKTTGNNDIALLHLADKVRYTDYIRPICLPSVDYPPSMPGTRLYISGWGLSEHGVQSDTKLKLLVPVVKTEICAKIYPNSTVVNTNQVCAGGEQGKDACRGDSGGPLMRTFAKAHAEEEQWFQEAIIYRGLGCGRKGVPGLYTRLSRYVKWVQNEITKY